MLACERASGQALDALVAVAAEMTQDPDYDAYLRLDARFHIGIAEAAQAPRLVQLTTDVQGLMTALYAVTPRPKVVIEQSNRQHAGIVRALKKGDRTSAGELVYQHVDGMTHILSALLADADSRDPRGS